MDTIYEHSEFVTFIAGMNAHFAAWRQKSAATLKALQADCHPKEIIAALAEGLLAHYAGRPLIDPYDIYQHLMDYWAEDMQDDCYLIAVDGWKAEAALDAQVYAQYPKLTEAEIKALVVDDKWLAALDAAIHGEMDRVSQQLTRRVKELAERYETPLAQMANRVAELEAKVNGHLERMGFTA